MKFRRNQKNTDKQSKCLINKLVRRCFAIFFRYVKMKNIAKLSESSATYLLPF